ncbi:DNA topoisomerase IV subunit A [Mycoplasma corogypsi]|uniref:DNA topoisomerase IV subunit A n=1 Tax=Mycoplasma corogypsi TaxID=2106 RepID=UPI0038735451
MTDKNKILDKIINESLDKIMSDRFGRYSKYVIQQRALPDVRDGLKPVQRRILYSMFGLGLEHDKQYKKSARIVGDVIGKYHPHGDSSVYDAMVNMSQWWKMNIPLLDMHGNIGSIDEDPAAAMRYTEVKMAKIAEYILGDIKKNTVTFAPNFDDSEIEPTVLPSIFPNILVNGAKGIAIGMATEMPPHNLNEVLDATIFRIKHPKSHISELFKYIKGPDFPTGAVIRGTKGIIEAFEKGKTEKDNIKLFSKFTTYTKGKNKFIEITEIPYGVNKSKLVYAIDCIINEQTIGGILEIKDQSDRDGINILITLDEDANERSILSYLCQKTDLQITYSYNNVVIKNNSPEILNLAGLIDSYIDHVKDVKTKTIEYDLHKSLIRLEIVEGFIKVSEITDQVIAVIRKAEGSKAGVIKDLIAHFDFTELQAKAIAELRLYRLSKTDKEAYLLEKAELEDLIKKLRLLLSDENEFNNHIIEQLKFIKKEFPTPRKTVIEENEFNFTYEQSDLVKEEEINIGISRQGYIKRLSQRVVDSNEFTTYGLKEEDYLIYYDKISTLNNLLVFTSLGNYAIVPAHKLVESKWKDLGMHLSDFVDVHPSEEIVAVFSIKDFETTGYFVIGTKLGMLKKTLIKDFEVSRINKFYTAIKLDDGDTVLNVCYSDGKKDVILISEEGFSTRYSEMEIGLYGTKAKGNKGIYLSLKDKVKYFTCANNDNIITITSDNGWVKKVSVQFIPYIPKHIKGKPVFKDLLSKHKFKISDMAVMGQDDLFITKDTLGGTHLVQQKPASSEENLVNLKIDNIYKLNIKKPLNPFDLVVQKDIFSSEVITQESKVIEENKQKAKQANLDIEALLKKVDGILNKDKKSK